MYIRPWSNKLPRKRLSRIPQLGSAEKDKVERFRREDASLLLSRERAVVL
jgi:hypothetical protein